MLDSQCLPYRLVFRNDIDSPPETRLFLRMFAQCSMPITDEEAAIQAIATLDALSTEQKEALHAINTILNNGEPFVDIFELFGYYDKMYFRNLLVPRVEVIWSPRLTL